MAKKVAYPGSFDPITVGHVDIIRRLCSTFDEVVVLVAQSSQKEALFSAEERKELVQKTLSDLPNLKVDIHAGLTTDYLKKNKISIIVRGLRAVVDYEYELTMANINKKIAPDIETMLVFANPEYYFISSRGVKELAINGGNLDGMVPPNVIQPLLKKLNAKKKENL